MVDRIEIRFAIHEYDRASPKAMPNTVDEVQDQDISVGAGRNLATCRRNIYILKEESRREKHEDAACFIMAANSCLQLYMIAAD